MSSWDFENIGFYNSDNPEQVKQFLECVGVDFTDVHASEAGTIGKQFRNATMGENHSDLIPVKLYEITNRLFGETVIFFEKESGSNTSDAYYRYEEIYDPKTNSIYIGEMDYDYGEGTVFNVSPYKLIKNECEMVAKERNIPIQWDIRDCGDLRPTGDEFSELCEQIYDKHGGLEGLGTRQKTENIPDDIIITDDDINNVITNLKAGWCDDLLLLFLMAFRRKND